MLLLAQSFKDSIRYHSIARSVYSDVDYGMRDNASVDGSASVIGELPDRCTRIPNCPTSYARSAIT
jgi:hypothetical protein